MTALLKRNLKLYFRDKVNLMFSMLAVFIVLALYMLFLGNMWGDAATRELPYFNVLLHNWLTAGKLAVAAVTTSLGAFGVMIDDRTRRIGKGFYASPIKRCQITSAYILNAFFVGAIMTTITFIPLKFYSIWLGGAALTVFGYVQMLALILLISFSSTAMVCFIATLTKTRNAFSTIGTILGTLIGFLLGIYLPIGELPAGVQRAIMLFPPSHGAVLLRQTLMHTPIQRSFDGIPVQYLEGFQEFMGIAYRFGDFEITPLMSIAILAASAAVFFGLAVMNMRTAKVQ